MYIKVFPFKEKDRHIFGLQGSPSVADIHAYAIEQMIAVRLDNQLALPACDLAEQTTQGSLRTGVEMHFRLLQKEQWRRVRSQQFRYHRKYLAYAVSDVNNIAARALNVRSQLPDLNLEWFAISLP